MTGLMAIDLINCKNCRRSFIIFDNDWKQLGIHTSKIHKETSIPGFEAHYDYIKGIRYE